MDYAQAQSSTCSTVPVKADKSNYWMPNLYFQDPNNGSFIRVPEQPYHKIYYKYSKSDATYDTSIQEFPKGFRMIAGDMTYRSEDDKTMGSNGTQYVFIAQWSSISSFGRNTNIDAIYKDWSGCVMAQM